MEDLPPSNSNHTGLDVGYLWGSPVQLCILQTAVPPVLSLRDRVIVAVGGTNSTVWRNPRNPEDQFASCRRTSSVVTSDDRVAHSRCRWTGGLVHWCTGAVGG
jgi:hypothetical protein